MSPFANTRLGLVMETVERLQFAISASNDRIVHTDSSSGDVLRESPVPDMPTPTHNHNHGDFRSCPEGAKSCPQMWECSECGETGMTTFIPTCNACGHRQCSDCTVYRPKGRRPIGPFSLNVEAYEVNGVVLSGLEIDGLAFQSDRLPLNVDDDRAMEAT